MSAETSGEEARWCVVDCETQQYERIGSFPFTVKLDGLNNGDGRALCILQKAGKKDRIFLARGDAKLCLNGEPIQEFVQLATESDYAVRAGARLLVMRGGEDLDRWRRQISFNRWFFFDIRTQLSEGPMAFDEIVACAQRNGLDVDKTVVHPEGLTTGFYLSDFLKALEERQPAAAPQTTPAGEKAAPQRGTIGQGLSPINSEDGEVTCPVCWIHFDRGDVMHIAVHESLRGDPVLGEDAPMRFSATRFNNHGQALDAMELPCSEMACPNCRRKLPPGFLDMPHHIVSIVGAPSSGKSYYLSVLAKVVPTVTFGQFGVTFKDADPTGNVLLNAMKNQLFSATSMERAALVKTQLEGVMYERLPRFGRLVALPRPFMFTLSTPKDSRLNFTLVFYDNAGEHFEPGRDAVESPGAQHVAHSSAIFFLFDPTANVEFRQRLIGHEDPQLRLEERLDQQETILAETEVRIKRLLALDFRKQLSVPLAFMVGKCDVWLSLLGQEPLQPTLRDRQLDLDAVQNNSKRVRELLMEICPSLVANAESISSTVAFFPVSAFGHSPTELPGGGFGPDPKRIRPMFVETPVLWALTKIRPGVVPVIGGKP